MVSLADHYRLFAKAMARDGTPLYRELCEGIADDPDLLDLTALAPPDQRRPNLLLAAVHYLLLSGAADPLGDHYPTVAEWRGRTVPPLGGRDPFAELVAFCQAHRGELTELLERRATQTNEVGRCAVLLPAFATVAAGAAEGRPLALVDLGAAAGLNLLFDRFAYHYSEGAHTHGGGDGDRRAGAAGSPVVLECQVRSGQLPDLSLPPVAFRVGVDQRPVDVDDDQAARWLLACQWPHHLERFRRLRAAIDLARATPDRGRVATGDVVDHLARVVATAPADAHLCLYHSWVAAYLSHARQEDLAVAVAEVARRRPLSWVFAEQPVEVPGLPVPAAAEEVKGATALVLVDFAGGRRRERRLADAHHHGRWLHWWGLAEE